MKSFQNFLAEEDFQPMKGIPYYTRGELIGGLNKLFTNSQIKIGFDNPPLFPSSISKAQYMSAVDMVPGGKRNPRRIAGGSVLKIGGEALCNAMKASANSHLAPFIVKTYASEDGAHQLKFSGAKYGFKEIPWSNNNPVGFYMYFAIDAFYSGPSKEIDAKFKQMLADSMKNIFKKKNPQASGYKKLTADTIIFQDMAVADYYPKVALDVAFGLGSIFKMQYGFYLRESPNGPKGPGKNIFETDYFLKNYAASPGLLTAPLFYNQVFNKSLIGNSSLCAASLLNLRKFLVEAKDLGVRFIFPGFPYRDFKGNKI